MPFSYDDCVHKGLLRKIPPSKDKAARSLKKAQKWLKEAQNTARSGASNSSVLASYMVMFHAARAILFRDGFRERSHACIGRYLEERYAKKKLLEGGWIELFDHHRQVRHDDQYDLSFFSTKEEADLDFELEGSLYCPTRAATLYEGQLGDQTNQKGNSERATSWQL